MSIHHVLRLEDLISGKRRLNTADVRALSATAWSMARQMTKDVHLLEEMVAEALFKLTIALEKGLVKCPGGVRVIMKNAMLDYVKRDRNTKEVSNVVWASDAMHGIREPSGSHEVATLSAMEVYDAIAHLSEEHRIVLRYQIEGLEAPEIAVALGINHGAARSRLQRSRAKLLKILEANRASEASIKMYVP